MRICGVLFVGIINSLFCQRIYTISRWHKNTFVFRFGGWLWSPPFLGFNLNLHCGFLTFLLARTPNKVDSRRVRTLCAFLGFVSNLNKRVFAGVDFPQVSIPMVPLGGQKHRIVLPFLARNLVNLQPFSAKNHRICETSSFLYCSETLSLLEI